MKKEKGLDKGIVTPVKMISEAYAISFNAVLDLTGDSNAAQDAAKFVTGLLFGPQLMRQAYQKPEVDDIIAGLKRAAEEEHGEKEES